MGRLRIDALVTASARNSVRVPNMCPDRLFFAVMQRVTVRVARKRRPVWYARFRLQSGRRVQKLIGPAWAERGRPPAGYFTKRTVEVWLRAVLDEARSGRCPPGWSGRASRCPRQRPSAFGATNVRSDPDPPQAAVTEHGDPGGVSLTSALPKQKQARARCRVGCDPGTTGGDQTQPRELALDPLR